MYCSLAFWGFALFLATVPKPVASTLVKTVNVSDVEVLKEYLCSSKRTISPNTHLVIRDLGMKSLNISVLWKIPQIYTSQHGRMSMATKNQ